MPDRSGMDPPETAPAGPRMPDRSGMAPPGGTRHGGGMPQASLPRHDVLEAELAATIGQQKPDLLGNNYRVLGTFDSKPWRQGLHGEAPPLEQAMPALQPFREALTLPPLRWGWYPADKR